MVLGGGEVSEAVVSFHVHMVYVTAGGRGRPRKCEARALPLSTSIEN